MLLLFAGTIEGGFEAAKLKFSTNGGSERKYWNDKSVPETRAPMCIT